MNIYFYFFFILKFLFYLEMVKKKHYIIVTYILQMKYLFFSSSIQIVKKINRSFLFLYHVAILIKDHIDWIKFLVDFFGYRLRVRSKQD